MTLQETTTTANMAVTKIVDPIMSVSSWPIGSDDDREVEAHRAPDHQQLCLSRPAACDQEHKSALLLSTIVPFSDDKWK
jgi:hypothetical protein